ncbi:MAG: hydrogenase small subunit [Armatimonadota bacterium]
MATQDLQEVPVIWLQGTGCSGCSISLLNSAAPRISNLLLEEIVPGRHIQLRFHPTIMAASGELALEILHDTEQSDEPYVLFVEGGLPERIPNIAGTDASGEEINIMDTFARLAKNAICVIAVGACATFGGIPAADPNPSGSMPVSRALERSGLDVPYINVPGCPPHPDWIVGTVVQLLREGIPGAEDLDEHRRPLAFFGDLIHENCPRRPDFDAGKYASHHGQPGCLYELGCKGPVTYSDCPERQWNTGVNWPIGAGSPCLGCVEPGFPDVGTAMYEKTATADLPHLRRDETTGEIKFAGPPCRSRAQDADTQQ